MTNERHCPKYGEVLESRLHAVRECLFLITIWQSVVPKHAQSAFFSLPLDDWLLWNLMSLRRWRSEEFEWQSFFSMLCWLLWKNRNLYVFANNNNSVQELAYTSIIQERSYEKSDSIWPQLNPIVLATWWSPLEKEWVKLNTDGAVSYIINCAFVGGVFRDVNARWLCGFLMAVGRETIFSS